MKIIVLLTVAATLFSSATTNSSAGGPLNQLVIVILAMWAVGVYEIWSKRFGLLASIASIVLSFVGGAAGLAIGGMAMEMTLSLMHFQGSLARSNHPLLYVFSVAVAILTILGAWSAIQIVVWIRNGRDGARSNA